MGLCHTKNVYVPKMVEQPKEPVQPEEQPEAKEPPVVVYRKYHPPPVLESVDHSTLMRRRLSSASHMEIVIEQPVLATGISESPSEIRRENPKQIPC